MSKEDIITILLIPLPWFVAALAMYINERSHK